MSDSTSESESMTDADKYTPKGQDVVTRVGGDPSASEGIENKEEMPPGTTYEWESPVDTSTSGTKDGVVIVKYPDGSSERVPVKVIVVDDPSKGETDADKYTPKGQDVTTKVGGDPSASEGIENKEEMPPGTTYEWESPVDTSTSGTKDGVVIVKYPDGSSERVPVKVIVTDEPTTPSQTDADKYTPQGQDVTTKVGGDPSASEGIENKEEMPPGTTYEWESPVDTSTSGTKDGVVIVKYPDGSSERVPVKVIVVDDPSKGETDADKYTPKGQDVTTKVGGDPSASEGIENKEEMPPGTTYEWESPVDTSTPGIKSGVVIVKYPDGSSERVLVRVIVEIPDNGGVPTAPNAEQTTSTTTQIKASDSTAPTVKPTNTDNASEELPQMGNENNNALGLVGLGLLASSALIVAKGKRKRKDN